MPHTMPLRGEPLPLDLVNTYWVDQGTPVDLFDSPTGLADWLTGHGLPTEPGDATRLVETRDAIRATLTGEPDGPDRLNKVLAHGFQRWRVTVDGADLDSVTDRSWLAAWRCATEFAHLLAERPERIRNCANPVCVLWFVDISKNGRRRWCSMEACGNRAKAGRFHQRHRGDA